MTEFKIDRRSLIDNQRTFNLKNNTDYTLEEFIKNGFGYLKECSYDKTECVYYMKIYTCAAVIIENRKDASEIIREHKKHLPKYLKTIHIKNHLVKSISDYNNLLTTSCFWEDLIYDRILIFQHDSSLLREGIEEFLEYDYVGAPWKFQEHGGNGGLSLRSKEAMIWCINQKPWNQSLGNEDVYFSNLLKDSPYKLAPREVCSKFSCESIYKEGTLGYHAIEKYLTPEEVIKIKTQYE